MIDRRELDRIAKKARLASAKRPDVKNVSVVMRDCGCIRCSYNLKGLRFDRVCPECGTPVNRSIVPEDPDAKPWQDASLWRPRWWIRMFGLTEPRTEETEPATKGKERPVVRLCPRCGYDCTGLPHRSPCPECGTARSSEAREAATEVNEAMQALVRHSYTGMFFAIGWAVTGLMLALQWLVFSAGASFADVPWAESGVFLYTFAAVGAAIATFASFNLLVMDPPPDLAVHTAIATRVIAVFASLLWCLSCAAIA